MNEMIMKDFGSFSEINSHPTLATIPVTELEET